MCSIFASRDIEELKELAKLNSYRGTHSHSFSTYTAGHVDIDKRAFGEFALPECFESDVYYIGHSQAPTTEEKTEDSIHPSRYYDCVLWHNGIIKNAQIQQWKKEFGMQWDWDTQWLNFLLTSNDFDVLSEVKGSFSCVWFDQAYLYMFRNDNSPMFVKGATISSTKFEGSEATEANVVYRFEGDHWLKTSMHFSNADSFFWTP